jgi:hypothetical protein
MTDSAEQATQDTDTATETAADAPRRRRVIRGDGMVTPKPGILVSVGTELLKPGSSRLIVDHDLVRRNPEAFTAAYAGDSEIRVRLRKMTRTRTRTKAGRDYLLPTGAMNDEEPKWELR